MPGRMSSRVPPESSTPKTSKNSSRDPVTPRMNDEVEERLHPSRFLGYDRDRIGLHLLSKEIYDVAEEQFRRAVYLNPYEAAFSQHLAWALFKRGRFDEAKRWIRQSLVQKPDEADSRYIAKRIDEEIQRRAEPPKEPDETADTSKEQP